MQLIQSGRTSHKKVCAYAGAQKTHWFSLQKTLNTMRQTISTSLSTVITPTRARAHSGTSLNNKTLLIGAELPTWQISCILNIKWKAVDCYTFPRKTFRTGCSIWKHYLRVQPQLTGTGLVCEAVDEDKVRHQIFWYAWVDRPEEDHRTVSAICRSEYNSTVFLSRGFSEQIIASAHKFYDAKKIMDTT